MQPSHSAFRLFPNMNNRKRRGLQYFLLSLPFVAFVFAFSYIPLFGWVYAFFDYQIGQRFLDFSQTRFIGVGNFKKLITQSGEVLRVLRDTFALSFLGILCSPIPVAFAILLNEIRRHKFKKFIQTATTLPNFISWILVYSLAFSLFSQNGLVNTLLGKFGVATANAGVLGSVDHAWATQVIISLWKNTGWGCIIYIASIAGIDAELFDAVYIDGGGRFRAIWHVIIPGIIPTYLVLLLLNISNMLKNGFEQYFLFYNPLVSDKLEVLDYYVYKIGFLINDYPYSITLCMLQTLLSVTLLFAVNAISKRARGQSLI